MTPSSARPSDWNKPALRYVEDVIERAQHLAPYLRHDKGGAIRELREFVEYLGAATGCLTEVYSEMDTVASLAQDQYFKDLELKWGAGITKQKVKAAAND